MIGYVTLGTNDLQRASAFYDLLAEELGIDRMMEGDDFIARGSSGGGASIGLTKPHDGKPASVGNGTVVALEASDAAHAIRIHQAALATGGTDEGAPGPRGGFHAAYSRDPDGNKLNAFPMAPPTP